MVDDGTSPSDHEISGRLQMRLVVVPALRPPAGLLVLN